jgi:transposase
MRKSYNGLAGSVEEHFHADPLNGHLYVFFNKRSTIVKILVWDRTGWVLYSKRLEAGQFQYQQYASKEPLDFARLLLILEGIDLRGSRQRRRFNLKGKRAL